jgi:uncharacterized phage protein gp47/JayE
LLGVTRAPAESALVSSDLQIVKFYVDSGTFGDINNSADMLIPGGTVISTDTNSTGILYRVRDDTTAFASDDTVWVSAEAIIPGTDSNVGTGSLVQHDFTGYTDTANNTLLVTNVHPVASGKDIESDANYRYRIVNAALTAEAANETAIRLAALTTAGVSDVVIVRNYRGVGTFGVIVRSVTPTVSEALLDGVTARVLEVQGLGSRAFVRKAKETGLSFTITVHYSSVLTDDDFELIELALEDEITDYVNSLDLAEEFSVDQLVSRLFEVDSNIANFGETGKPLDEVFVYKDTRLEDNKLREKLLGDYTPTFDEHVIIEPSITTPFTFERKFVRR